jgi:hypothetical protein
MIPWRTAGMPMRAQSFVRICPHVVDNLAPGSARARGISARPLLNHVVE